MKTPDWYDTAFDPYCLAVGRLSTTWAALERGIDELIWELLGASVELGACATAQMIGPGPRVRALLALVDVWGASRGLAAEFSRFAKQIESLGGARNRYAHDTVHIGTRTRNLSKVEVTANKKLRFDQAKVEMESIHALWLEIREARGRLIALRESLIEQVPAWTNRHRARYVASPPVGTKDPNYSQ